MHCDLNLFWPNATVVPGFKQLSWWVKCMPWVRGLFLCTWWKELEQIFVVVVCFSQTGCIWQPCSPGHLGRDQTNPGLHTHGHVLGHMPDETCFLRLTFRENIHEGAGDPAHFHSRRFWLVSWRWGAGVDVNLNWGRLHTSSGRKLLLSLWMKWMKLPGGALMEARVNRIELE